MNKSETDELFDGISDDVRLWIENYSGAPFRNAESLMKALPSSLRVAGIANAERLFDIFNQHRRMKKHKKKHMTPAQKVTPTIEQLPYPFRTKIKAYNEKHAGESIEEPEYVQDYNIKSLAKNFKRPNYSPKPHSYEMDIMFAEDDRVQKRIEYLVLININTRYLAVVPLKSKSAKDIIAALSTLDNKLRIDYLKFDGETGFRANELKEWWIRQHKGDKEAAKHLKFDSSPYTFHNKHVDSVIRTIRNAAGLSYQVLRNNNYVQQIVDYYNATPHNGLPTDEFGNHYTPNEVQADINIEWEYIRQKDRELAEVNERIKNAGLDKYKLGNVLLLYLDRGKTSQGMKKRRRNFEDIGIFIKYKGGNVVCNLLSSTLGRIKTITVPLFYTKKVAKNIEELAPKYKRLFGFQ